MRVAKGGRRERPTMGGGGGGGGAPNQYIWVYGNMRIAREEESDQGSEAWCAMRVSSISHIPIPYSLTWMPHTTS